MASVKLLEPSVARRQGVEMNPAIRIGALVLFVACAGVFGQSTYSNGPLVTHPGAGLNGLDVSALDGTMGLTIYGWGAIGISNVRVIDDFTVPYGQTWTLQTISGFTYQTNSGPPSTITHGDYRIWSASPLAGGTILHDHSASNQMTATNFTNIYRTLITALGDVARPIMQVDMNGNGITLPAGTYWLDYTFNGTGAAGPWVPPITTYPAVHHGNALQFNAALPWVPLIDGTHPQGLPFLLAYTKSFTADITQPNGPGTAVHIDDVGAPNTTVINVATLFQGGFPNGWLFGVDVPFPELANMISFGAPFVVTLGPTGTFSVQLPLTLPGALTVYYVGIELQGSQLIARDDPKSVVLQ
jgi:hypothetical protein